MIIHLPRRIRRLTGKLVRPATIAAKPYALYRDPQGCDSDDWGRPKGRYATLTEAMNASGRPPYLWSLNVYTPDETYVLAEPRGTEWSILKPGVMAEVLELRGEVLA